MGMTRVNARSGPAFSECAGQLRRFVEAGVTPLLEGFEQPSIAWDRRGND